MVEFLKTVYAKAKVLARAVPTYGALAVGVLTFLSTSVVPYLPGHWGVKVGAYLAAAYGFVQTVVSVVSRVTPVLFPEDVGLLPNTTEEVVDPFGPEGV